MNFRWKGYNYKYTGTVILIAIILISSFVVLPSFGEGESDIRYSVNGSELRVFGTGDMADYSTASSAPWSEYKTSVTSVVIQEGVTSIGNMAFFSFTKLENVSLPSTLTSIGDSAFYNCSSLKTLDFPESLTDIGEYSFEGCSSLASVSSLKVNNLSEGVFSGCGSLEYIDLSSIGSIDGYAFENCISLCEIKISLKLKSILSCAFDNCPSLDKINYQGSEADFKSIDISSGNDSLYECDFIWHYGQHSFDTVVQTVSAGCTSEGYTVRSCSCGATEKFDIVAPAGHSYIHYTAKDDQESHTAMISYCTVCSDFKYEKLNEGGVPSVYTVTWIINDLIITEKYSEGQIPGADFVDLEYTASNGAKFIFDSFYPAVSAVTSNVTYTAVFKSVDGLYDIDGKSYYYLGGERMTGWQEIEGEKYYFLRSTGEMVSGAKTIGGVEYLFDQKGRLYSGWYSDELGTKYYKEGISLRSWQDIEGKTYYFYVRTGLLVKEPTAVIGGLRREFNQDHSVMPISGWQYVNNKIYYYRGGNMQTGWQEIDGQRYYFLKSDDKFGSMTWGWQTIGGKLYYFYSYKGTLGEGGNLFSQSGNIGGKYYEIGEEGNVLVTGLHDDGSSLRYFNQDHTMVRNTFITVGDKKYYFNGEGQALRDTTQSINGVLYTFDKNGVCLEERKEDGEIDE